MFRIYKWGIECHLQGKIKPLTFWPNTWGLHTTWVFPLREIRQQSFRSTLSCIMATLQQLPGGSNTPFIYWKIPFMELYCKKTKKEDCQGCRTCSLMAAHKSRKATMAKWEHAGPLKSPSLYQKQSHTHTQNLAPTSYWVPKYRQQWLVDQGGNFKCIMVFCCFVFFFYYWSSL